MKREKNADLVAVRFPIVGIGASAGGLEALEQFLGNVPENSGMAYVVVQHLDPTQKGLLPEFLQRISRMDVFQVKDRMVVKPNRVYVIPPGKNMSIQKGILHLFEPIEARGKRLPINFFFQSLADNCLELGVGVILSGMGSDGSIGISAIKERNGIGMVQEPSNAKFDSMPRNAINSTQIDVVAPANELPSRLLEFLKHAPTVKLDLDVEIKDKSALEKIILLLRTYTGNDFSSYKKNTIYRRIERRMEVHKIDKIASYVLFLQENPKEIDILFKELMIGVTSFFRDAFVWDALKKTVLPDMINNLQPGSILRAWIPGCSTGEEAYSLAIVFKEVVEKINPHGGFSLQIFATDLNNEAIEIARKGIFPASIADDMSANRLNRFFLTTDDGYFINTEIREMVVFAQHNIIMHPAFTRIDILTCRNLLIYMEPELQKKLLGLFYFCMNPGGIMMLGGAETLGTQSHLFMTANDKCKIFTRVASIPSPESLNFHTTFSLPKAITIEKHIPVRSSENIQTLTDQLLLKRFSPAGVLVNEKGDIIYLSGPTEKYLEPAVGKANLNIFALLRKGLRNEFPVAFRKVLLTKKSVILQNINVDTPVGKQTLNVNIEWIDKPDPLNGMIMIIFTYLHGINEIKLPAKNVKNTLNVVQQRAFEKEIKYTHEKIQVTLEEMQTSQEELTSTNEELQSTNEELQSTNEELTTSKEEMQSLNEELQTVNTELQSKIDDFSRLNDDMKNLLNSTDIATLFIDKKLNIRRYTDQATKIFKLIKSDIGRPFTDMASGLIYPELAADAIEVLKTLKFINKQIPAKDGRWFSIRIMPYRTFNDRIDGLVIAFFNISDLKQVEGKLQEKEQMHRLLLSLSSDVIIKLSTDWEILEFNPKAERFFGKKKKDVINQNYLQLLIPEPMQKKTETEMKKLLNQKLNGKLKMQVMAAGNQMSIVEWTVNVLYSNPKIIAGIILTLNK